MTKNNGKNGAVKRGRGRPAKTVNLNFGKGRAFTVDMVLNREERNGHVVSRAAVYNKIVERVRRKTAVVVDHVALQGRGHPNYRYRLVA